MSNKSLSQQLLLMVFFVFLLLGRSVHAEKVVPKSWREQMGELSQALKDIGPDLFSKSKTPGSKAFKAKAKKLYDISKAIDPDTSHGAQVPDQDPTLPYLSSLFREDMGRAYRSLQAGHIDYAKGVIRSSVSYCIACHTRSNSGAQFPLLSSFSSQLSTASWVDRISFQAASRQFDPVYNEVVRQLKGRQEKQVTAMDLEKGVQIALAITVRVKQSPEQAMTLAKSVFNSPLMNDFMKKKAQLWIKDIGDWQREGPRTYEKDADYLAQATQLVGILDAKSEAAWKPGSEVKYLRASMLMHQMLGKYPNSPLAAEALYLTGLSYDVLQDLGIWSIHEMYYQACIEKKPHSELAERCYERYKESVIFGYSGSAGTFVPDIVQIHLKQLQRMAEVKTVPAKIQ